MAIVLLLIPDAVTTSAEDRDIISRGSDPIGPIIGGILGGLCLLLFLLLLVVTLIVILVKIQKSKDKTKYTHQEGIWQLVLHICCMLIFYMCVHVLIGYGLSVA